MIIPFSGPKSSTEAKAVPPEDYLLMAAAQMHEMDRLFETKSELKALDDAPVNQP